MNESDTPSHHRLLKAARRTTRAEVTLVTIVTIITLWSFYALYKLSIGGSDSILGSSGSLKSRTPTIGPQEQLSADVESNDSSQASSQNGLTSKYASALIGAREDLKNRRNSKFQQEVESKFREQLIRDILTKQRELYGNPRSQSDSYGRMMWPNELDLRRPLPPMWLNNRRNSTNYSDPVNRSIVTMREFVNHAPFISYGPQVREKKNEARKIVGRNPLHHIPSRNFNNMATRNIDRDVGESISVDRTAMTTQEPPLEADSLANDNRSEDSYEDEGNGTRNKPVESSSEEESDGQQKGETEASDQKDSDDNENESNSGSSEDSSDNEMPDRSNEDQKSEPIDEASLDRAKKASTSIDEEVDRMTQPSSDNAFRQPANDSVLDRRSIQAILKGAVQFDDTLGGSIIDHEHQKLPKPIEPGGLIAHFVAPSPKEPLKKSAKGTIRKGGTQKADQKKLASKQDSRDLLIDHNQPAKITSEFADESDDSNSSGTKQKVGDFELYRKENKSDEPLANTRVTKKYTLKQRLRRSIDHYGPGKELKYSNSTEGAANREIRKSPRNKSVKRSEFNEFDEYSDGEDDEYDEKQTRPKSSKAHAGTLMDAPKPEVDAIYENYTLPSASDISIQDLLAHKRLLDELDKSRLPAPRYWAPLEYVHLPLTNQTGSNNHVASASVPVDTSKPAKDSSYDSIHSTHTETETEDSTRKSMLKKGSKKADSNAKSKLAESLNKGGSKSKKHNLEEKKYLKEKKFRGAKSGKKSAKGKGGKGGKKGTKYYKDKGFKKKGFKNIYVKNEFGQKKSYFDEFRDKDFKKKWKNFDDKYNYAQMKKWQTKDVKGAKKMKDQGEKSRDYDKSKWKKKYHAKQSSEASKKKKKYDEFRR